MGSCGLRYNFALLSRSSQVFWIWGWKNSLPTDAFSTKIFSDKKTIFRQSKNKIKGQKLPTAKKVKANIAFHGNPISELREVTCHMGSHSVTCQPTQVNAPRLTPAMQAGTRFTYPLAVQVLFQTLNDRTTRGRTGLGFVTRDWTDPDGLVQSRVRNPGPVLPLVVRQDCAVKWTDAFIIHSEWTVPVYAITHHQKQQQQQP